MTLLWSSRPDHTLCKPLRGIAIENLGYLQEILRCETNFNIDTTLDIIQSQSYKFEEIANNFFFLIGLKLKQTTHVLTEVAL